MVEKKGIISLYIVIYKIKAAQIQEDQLIPNELIAVFFFMH